MSSQSSSDIRQECLSRRNALSPSDITSKSSIICSELKGLPEYRKSKLPLLYVSFRSEVCTHELIRERLAGGLAVAVPRTDVEGRRLIPFLINDWEKDLRPGAYGIPEPDPEKTVSVKASSIDLIIIPGSVFDRRCGRYGYGGGYYDRFLEKENHRATRIGLSFHLQIRDRIPLSSHDRKMDIIVTEKEIIRCSGQPSPGNEKF